MMALSPRIRGQVGHPNPLVLPQGWAEPWERAESPFLSRHPHVGAVLGVGGTRELQRAGLPGAGVLPRCCPDAA